MSTLKRLNCAAKSVWCPSSRYASLLACAASTDIIGDDYIARSTLGVYDMALNDLQSEELVLLGSATVKGSITCLGWGSKGIDESAPNHVQLQSPNSKGSSAPKGILATGLDNNVLNLWNADAIAQGKGEAAILATVETSSPLSVLQFHPTEHMAFATGSRDGELLLWDLSRLDQPNSRRAAQQTRGGIACLAWNRRVQQLFATASEQGETSIWDMRQKNPLRSVMPSNRISLRPNALSWDDEVHFATSHYGSPAVDIWDLRKPNGCVARLHHPASMQAQSQGYGMQQQNSVIHSSFCPQDRRLFSTVSDDGTNALWRADTGALLSITNIPECSELNWAPHEPGVALCSSPSSVTIASLTNMGSYVPAWAPRRAGVSFGFGGKLLAFGHDSAPQSTPASPAGSNMGSPTSSNTQWTNMPQVQQPSVLIHTLPADPKVQADAMAFYSVAVQNGYVDFTQTKVSECESELSSMGQTPENDETPETADAKQWRLISLLYSTQRSELGHALLEELNFKGADESALENLSNPAAAIDKTLKEAEDQYNRTVADAHARADSERNRVNSELEASLYAIENSVSGTAQSDFDVDAMLSGGGSGGDFFSMFNSGSGGEGPSSAANPEDSGADDAETKKQKSIDEAHSKARNDLAAIDETLNEELSSADTAFKRKKTQLKRLSDEAASDVAQGIQSGSLVATPPVNASSDAPIRDAVIAGKLELASKLCLAANRPADALLLAACAGEPVWSEIRSQYLQTHRQPFFANSLPYILQGDYNSLVLNSKLGDWKQTLASLISTYFDTQFEAFASLATILGDRLKAAAETVKAGASPSSVGIRSELAAASASFYCYLSAMNIEKIVQLWTTFPSLTQAAVNRKLQEDQRQAALDVNSPNSYSQESKESASLSPSASVASSLAMSIAGPSSASTVLPLLLVEKATSLAVALHQSCGAVPHSIALMHLYGDYISRLVSSGLHDLAYGFLSLAQMFSQNGGQQAEDPLLVMRDLLVNSHNDAEALKQDLAQRKQPLQSPWNVVDVAQDPLWLQYQNHRQQEHQQQQQQFQQAAAAAAAAAASANVVSYGNAPAVPTARYGQPAPAVQNPPAPVTQPQTSYYGSQNTQAQVPPTAAPQGVYSTQRQTPSHVMQSQPQHQHHVPERTATMPTQPSMQQPMQGYAAPTHALPSAPAPSVPNVSHMGRSTPAQPQQHIAPTPVQPRAAVVPTPTPSSVPNFGAGTRPAPASNPMGAAPPMSQPTIQPPTQSAPIAQVPAESQIDRVDNIFNLLLINLRLNAAVDVAAANTQEARKSATRVKGLDQLYSKVGTPEISQKIRDDLVHIIAELQKGDHASALTYCSSLNEQSSSQSFWFVCLKSLLVTARNLGISL